MKKQLFIFSFAVAMAMNAMAFNERVMFDPTNNESNWTFIESQFISKPADYKKSVWTHVQATLTGLAVVGGAATFGALYYNDKLAKTIDPVFNLGTISGGATVGATVLYATSALECYLSNHANYLAVEDFFNNWEENQFFVPEELQDAFYTIAELIEFEGSDYIVNNANNIVDAIQFVVMRHFEKRYEKVLQITAATSLADAKTSGEILKNAVETASKIGTSSK